MTKFVRKVPELCRRFDVPSKENESPRLDSSDEVSIGGIYLGAGNAKEQKLTMRGAFHTL